MTRFKVKELSGVPQTVEEARELVDKMEANEQQMIKVRGDYNRDIQERTTAFQDVFEPLEEAHETMTLQLKSFFEANSKTLLKKGKKSCKLGAATIGTRKDTVSVVVKDQQEAIGWLLENGFRECVFLKQGVTKASVIKNREEIDGKCEHLVFKSQSNFFVKFQPKAKTPDSQQVDNNQEVVRVD